jgi:Flp pilus assembly secretin CpaC
MNIIERNVLGGKIKALAKPRLNTRVGARGSFLAGSERAVPIPPGQVGSIGVQFDEIGLRVDYGVTELSETRTDLTVRQMARMEVSLAFAQLEPDPPLDPTKPSRSHYLPARSVRESSTRTVELGVPFRMQIRGPNRDVDCIVDITIRPPK